MFIWNCLQLVVVPSLHTDDPLFYISREIICQRKSTVVHKGGWI